MSSFREREINQAKFERTSFREFQLQLIKSLIIDTQKDWINHEHYMKNDYDRQRKILPPFISNLNKAKVEEKDAYDVDNEKETKIEVNVE